MKKSEHMVEMRNGIGETITKLKLSCGGVYIYGAVDESEGWGWLRDMKRQSKRG